MAPGPRSVSCPGSAWTLQFIPALLMRACFYNTITNPSAIQQEQGQASLRGCFTWQKRPASPASQTHDRQCTIDSAIVVKPTAAQFSGSRRSRPNPCRDQGMPCTTTRRGLVFCAVLLLASTAQARQLLQTSEACTITGFEYQGLIDFPSTSDRLLYFQWNESFPFTQTAQKLVNWCNANSSCDSISIFDFGDVPRPADWGWNLGALNPVMAPLQPKPQSWVSNAAACSGLYYRACRQWDNYRFERNQAPAIGNSACWGPGNTLDAVIDWCNKNSTCKGITWLDDGITRLNRSIVACAVLEADLPTMAPRGYVARAAGATRCSGTYLRQPNATPPPPPPAPSPLASPPPPTPAPQPSPSPPGIRDLNGTPATDGSSSSGNTKMVVIAAAVAGPLVVLAAVAVGICIWRRRSQAQAGGQSGDKPAPFPGIPDMKTASDGTEMSHTYMWHPILGGKASQAMPEPHKHDVVQVVVTTTGGSSTAGFTKTAASSQLGTPTWGSRQVGAGSLAATGTNMQPVLPAYQGQGHAARNDIDTTMVLRDRKLQSINIDWTTIQVYEDQCLGHGGFGAVYGGLWMDVTPVAVKMLHAERVNEEVLNALRQEAFIMCDITHPYVARVYGLVDDGQHHALVMSWYKNGSVSGMMAKGKYAELDMLERVKIAYQVACGMCSLHGRKPNPIIHGDLKTSNLLIENDGNSVVIADFGLAACLRRGQSGHVVDSGAMTLTISPPEVLADPTAPRTTAGDVYAFGITLLEIVTGRPAYSGINRDQLKRLVLSGGRPAIPVSVPPEVASIIRDCWAQQPQDRPSFAVVFAKLSTAMTQLKQQLTLTSTQTGRKLADISMTLTTTNW